MNEKEQKAADALLDKIQSAKPEEVANFATAYQALTQGVLCRKQAEATGK